MASNSKIMAIVAVVILVLVGVAAAVVLTNNSDDKKGPEIVDGKVVAASCDPYTITDAAGQKFTFDHTFGPAAMTACTYGGAFFPLAAMVGKDLPAYIAGMDLAYSKSTTFGFIFDEMTELNKVTDIYSSGTNANAVLSSGATVVIDLIANQVKNEAAGGLKEKLSGMDIPILYLNFQSEDSEIIANGMRMIGALWGLNNVAEELAQFYIDHTQYIFDKSAELIAKNGGERPLICAEYAGSVSTVKTSWSKDVQWGSLIYRVGGRNMVDDGPNYPQLTLANILATQPTTMMYSSNISYGDDTIHIGYGYTVEDTLNDVKRLYGDNGREGYKDLPAWTSDPKSVYVVNHMVNRNLFGFAAVEFIAKMVWPDEYKDLNPAQDLEDFWKEWMPFSYQGCWMVDVGEYI